MVNKSVLFAVILLASCLNNLIIPYLIYYKKYGLFKKRERNFVGVNAWGIIMDGLLAGIINIISLNFLLVIKPAVSLQLVSVAIFLGLIFTLCCHLYMAVTRWKIWIMPKPWQWNEAGYWHMISMTIQMSFSAFCFIIILADPRVLKYEITGFTLASCFVLSFLFLASLQQQHKGLRIGVFNIDNKPW